MAEDTVARVAQIRHRYWPYGGAPGNPAAWTEVDVLLTALAAAERRATRVETFIATLRDEMHVQSDPYAREYGDRIDDALRVWAVEKTE